MNHLLQTKARVSTPTRSLTSLHIPMSFVANVPSAPIRQRVESTRNRPA